MAKILVADDEADLEMLIKQKFRQQIRQHKYEFIFALNGNQALDQLKQNPDVDIVLSDINMPELDGLSLLTKLNEANPLVKTVMVSAYSDMDNIRTAMNRGAFDFVCKPVNFMDLEMTIEKTMLHVNQLKQTLQAIKENNILRMYVDETVLKFMNKQEFETSLMVNETIEATVAFIDICDFTSISESEPADKVVGLLNKYFDIMVKEIIAQDGYIDKFIGDAIMAVFRGDYHVDRAIEASLNVRKQIEKMEPELVEGAFVPQISMGINTGDVISGNIGSATLRRLDYTVIGDVVNTAQRIQAAANPGQILISDTCYSKVKDSFYCKEVGMKNFRHKTNAALVYEVIS